MRNYLVIISLIFIIASCGVNNNTTVARVDNFSITLNELKTELPKKNDTVTPQDYNQALETLINQKLRLIEAYRQNLEQSEKVRNQIKEIEKRQVYLHLLDEEFISSDEMMI